jgi:exodeoxyribonuclease VII large subunit
VIDAQNAAAARAPWGVAALLLAAGDALAARLGAVAVRGELAGFARAASGHCYFALKDDAGAPALLRCAMFRRAASLLDFLPADGQRVELRGRLEIYAGRGEMQLVVESMQRVGAGSLFEEFLRLKARLEAQGLFDAARKRALPTHPRAIGVVTSTAGAALHDVLATLARRAPHVRVVVYPSLVQGAEAPPALVAALQTATLRRAADGVEVLLLVRGGGSLEDLWAFNDERVVRAVATSPLPVVCGVGHETDVTLADLAADLRAPTPTGAAELAAPARDELLAALGAFEQRHARALRRALRDQAQRLDRLALRLAPTARALGGQRQALQGLAHRLALGATALVRARAQALDLAALRLVRAAATGLSAQRARLHAAQARLEAQDPHRVLRRGYAWVEADGRPVTGVGALAPGQEVSAVWADGRARARVLDVQPAPTTPQPPRR